MRRCRGFAARARAGSRIPARASARSGSRAGPAIRCRNSPSVQTFARLTAAMLCTIGGIERCQMRHASTVQYLLIAILLAAHAGTAYAAEGPFIPIDLGTLGGNALANAVNDSGRVVGVVYGAEFRAFSWTPAEGMSDLGTVDCGGGSEADAAATASGHIVGCSGTCAFAKHAFTW